MGNSQKYWVKQWNWKFLTSLSRSLSISYGLAYFPNTLLSETMVKISHYDLLKNDPFCLMFSALNSAASYIITILGFFCNFTIFFKHSWILKKNLLTLPYHFVLDNFLLESIYLDFVYWLSLDFGGQRGRQNARYAKSHHNLI